MTFNEIRNAEALYCAIGLTGQTNCHDLTQFMIERMLSWDFVKSVAIFEVYIKTGRENNRDNFIFRRVAVNFDASRIVNDEPGLFECAWNRVPVEQNIHGSGTRLVFPVESSCGPLRLISLDGKNITPEQRVLFMHLVTLFKNQVNLLDEKERDTLTGLLNRHTFDQRLIQVSQTPDFAQGSAFLAALDIDHFKKVNDNFGHLIGDEVLLRFSQLMKRYFRYTDFLFRFGGEEFIILLNHTSMDGAAQALERFRIAVQEYLFPSVGRITVSIGYTRIKSSILPTSLIDQADKALYNAKENGRNLLIFYDDFTPNEHKINGDAHKLDGEIELF